jgi:heat shock protein HtpX
MSAGLKTHIWNNNLKSAFLLGLYPFLLMGTVWLCVLAYSHFTTPQIITSGYEYRSTAIVGTSIEQANDFIYTYWPIIIAMCSIWFLISYFFHTQIISSLAHAKPVTRQQEPELYNLLENICIARGMQTPKFNIIETHALNAFASGINQKTYTVTVTRGLLNRLSKDEVEGVLAHELTHIINHDVRLMMISIVFTGIFGLAAQMVWNNLRFAMYMPRERDRKGNGFIVMLVILVILWAGYLATILTRFAISRRREYMADAGAVDMTKNPDAMMRALMRISGRGHIPETTGDIAFMCIENSKPFMGLIATHPPIQKRIEALSMMTGEPIPVLSPRAPKEEQISNNERPANPWITRERGYRKNRNPWG